MKELKKKLFRVFFCAEVLVFVLLYWFGTQGMQTLRQLRYGNKLLAQQVAEAEQELVTLEEYIVHCEQNNFYKEKIAREQLQMARADETIYYVTKES